MTRTDRGRPGGPTIDLGQGHVAHPVSGRVFLDALRSAGAGGSGGLLFQPREDGRAALGSLAGEGTPLYWLFRGPEGNRCGLAAARLSGERLHLLYTLVAPAARRQGLYRRYLHALVDWAEAEDLRAVCSQQPATASPPLIAKLQAGFLVEGLSLEPERGALLSLVRHRTAAEREAMRFRAGEQMLPRGLVGMLDGWTETLLGEKGQEG